MRIQRSYVDQVIYWVDIIEDNDAILTKLAYVYAPLTTVLK